MNITRMNSERPEPQLQPILSEEQKLNAKHSIFVQALNREFPEAHLRGSVQGTKETFPTLGVLSKLEDYIAGKRQLLNLLSVETEADFYETLSNQIELSQIHYMKLYQKFSRP